MSQQFNETPPAIAANSVKNSDAASTAARGVLGDVLTAVASDASERKELRMDAANALVDLGLATQVGAAAPAGQTVVQHFVTDAQTVPVNGAGEAVSAVVNGLVPTNQVAAAQPVPVEETQPAFLPSVDIPDDVAAWLAEPEEVIDLPEDYEGYEPGEETQVEEEEPEYLTIEDPQLQAERKKRLAAEKRAQHAESLRAREMRGHWAKEVQNSGLALSPEQLAGINATSRRGFWRQAKAFHDSNVSVLKSLGVDPGAIRAQAAAEAEQSVQQQRREAWGPPMVAGPQGMPPAAAAAAARQERIAQARRGSSFVSLVKEMINPTG